MAADDDFDDWDESLFQAVAQYEQQKQKAGTNSSNTAIVGAVAQQQQQQQGHNPAQQQQQHSAQQQQQQHAINQQPPRRFQGSSSSHNNISNNSNNNQQQQHAGNNLNQIWGLFCNGPPPAQTSNTACTGFANRRLQQQQRWKGGSSGNNSKGTTHVHHQQQQQHTGGGQSRPPPQPNFHHQQQQQWGSHGPPPQQQQQQQQQQQGQLQHSNMQQQQQWQPPALAPQHQHQQQHHADAAGRPPGSNWQPHAGQPPPQQQQQQQYQQHMPPRLPPQQQQQQQQQWQQQQHQAPLQQQQQQWQQGWQQHQAPLQQQQLQQQGWQQQPPQQQMAGHAPPPGQQQQQQPAVQHPPPLQPQPQHLNQPGAPAGVGGSSHAGPAQQQQPQQPQPQPQQQPFNLQPQQQQQQPQQQHPGQAVGPDPFFEQSHSFCSSAGAGPGPAAAASGGVSGPAAAAAASGPGSAGVSGAAAAAGGVSGGGGAPSVGFGAIGGGGASGGGPLVLYDAKLSLGKDRHVEVVFSGWHNQIAAVCSSVAGCKRADGAAASWGRNWLVPADKVAELQQALDAKLPSNVRVRKFEPLPDLVRNVLAAADRRPDDTQLYEHLTQLELAPGVSLADRMRPFQREGVKFGLRAGGRLLIGDEMGLGKTVQACALAKCYQAEWPVLVVTPSSLRLSWAAALYQWLRVTEDRVLVTLKRADMKRLSEATTLEAARKMYDFIIVSYDLLKDTQPVLTALDIRVVILDESHCIKNSTAQRTKFAKPLVEKAQRAILLSGTPALSNPAELLTQLQALLPKARITKMAFEDRYMDVRNFGNFKKAVGGKNGEELNRLLTSTVMIRRKKAEVLKDLPAKNRTQVPLLLDPSKRAELDRLKGQLNELKQLSNSLSQEEGAEGGLLSGQQRNQVMLLWHETAKIKSKAVTDYVKELLLNSGSDDKFLVFAYHRELMDAIEKGVNEVRGKNKELKELKYMRIDGQTPPKQREENVNNFQDDQACRVAILNIKAAGVGLTLTRASTVVFAELAWTPSEVQQAEDRAHRIGQTQSVNVHLLLVKDSIDDLMWELLQNKLATTGQVLDGQATRMEVQRTTMQPAGATAKGRGGGASGGGGSGAHRGGQQQQDSQQPSISTFFASAPGGGGQGGASKKQRTE